MNQSSQFSQHRYRRFFVNFNRFYQQKNVRIYTEVILSLLTVSFFLFFAIKPTATAISGLVKKIDDQKMASEKLANKIQALAAAQENYRALKSDFYLVDEALPKNSELTTLTKQLEALARQSSVKIQLIKFGKTYFKGANQEQDKPAEINFTLKADGLYPNLKVFLQSLDSLRRIISVEEFGFASPEKKEQEALKTGILELNLEAKAFYLFND